MRAEALQRAVALVPRGPVIQFPAQITDLFPQQACRAITTAALEFNNGRGDFDHAGVEINGAARGQLKRFAGARNHSGSHQAAGITKDFFRTPPVSVNEKIKFRFQPDHRSGWRCTRSAKTKTMRGAFCSAVLHLLTTETNSLRCIPAESTPRILDRCGDGRWSVLFHVRMAEQKPLD